MTSSVLIGADGVSQSKRFYARIPKILDVPNLIQVQLESFNWLKGDGLKELFEDVCTIPFTYC